MLPGGDFLATACPLEIRGWVRLHVKHFESWCQAWQATDSPRLLWTLAFDGEAFAFSISEQIGGHISPPIKASWM